MAESSAAAQAAVDAAYALHDSLYAISAEERAARMSSARDEALAAVAAYEASGVTSSKIERRTQARLLYLRGKALACSASGRQELDTERHLASAIKLDPSIIDAWNCLGECYWERGDFEMARHTFRAALNFERNAATLCHLSMLLRSMSTSTAAGAVDALLSESVALAKESVRLDTTSSRNWAGLGAAHMSLHMHVSSEAEDLHLANKAFTQARAIACACSSSPFHAAPRPHSLCIKSTSLPFLMTEVHA
jgi:tetratricopeptide (TPR) repeat protein